ncbi:MAG: hypothetical protein VX656_15675 [Candidatus Latescibacterota bacterium]|nr:hypothetical protein [Candidatus Latescibacterota bacterium]
MKRAIDAGKCQLNSSDEPWIHFHVGSAYSYRAMARFRRHNWIGAFLDDRRSIDHLKKALKGDQKLYDVYFGLGGYHYWRTARAGFIRAVAFWMPDRRELGRAANGAGRTTQSLHQKRGLARHRPLPV